MTFEELLGKSASDLSKMTDTELDNYFKPYYEITRPDRAAVNSATSNVLNKTKKGGTDPRKLAAMTILAKMGIDLDEL